MFKFSKNQHGFAQLVVILLLLGGLIVGVYLVQQTQIFKSKAAPNLPQNPETSFELELEKNSEAPFPDEAPPNSLAPNTKFRVDVYARSDIEEANLFAAKIKYTSDTIDLVEINKRENLSFVKNWVETSVYPANQSIGMINMSGGIPNPGIKTDSKSGALLMGSIIFKTKGAGIAKIGLSDGNSAIYSNANNINILSAIKGTLEVPIQEIQPTPSPTPKPISCSSITVEGAIQSKSGDQIIYIIDSEGKVKLTANVIPTTTRVVWKAYASGNLSGEGTFEPSDNPITTYTIPKNSGNQLEGIQVKADIVNSDPINNQISCPTINMAVKPATTPPPSSSPTPIVTPTVAVIEVTNGVNTPEIEKVVAKEFYKKYEDKYDFLALFFNYNYNSYYHRTTKNDVTGIGSQNYYIDGGYVKLDENPIFDKTSEYGSKGKLLGIGVIGGKISNYSYYPTGANNILLHEVLAHQFGVYLGGMQNSSDPLPVQEPVHDGHWTNCLHFPREDQSQPYWDARLWRDNGDETWTRLEPDTLKEFKFDPLMLYMMGFIPPERVPNAILLEPEGGHTYQICWPGATIKATPKQISVNDIIKRYGPRKPSYQNSQKEFSTAFVLVTEKGTYVDPKSLETLTKYAKEFPDVIQRATTYSERMTGLGDSNLDGKNDLIDLSILLSEFNKNPITKTAADLNGDRKINTFDFSLMKNLLIDKKIIKVSK